MTPEQRAAKKAEAMKSRLRPQPPERFLLRKGVVAKDMSILYVSPDHREMFEEIALSIFTDMTNAGASLQMTLAAIYLSGIENALASQKAN